MIKYILSFLLVVNTASAMNSNTRTIQANEIDGVTGFKNLVENSGFERGLRAWTASGGTFTTTTTTADVGSGSRAGSWDSNSASQTLTSTAVAIPAGDYGANYEVGANLKCASGTCTHLLQAFDGTNVISSQTITSSLTYARTTLNFPAPTSGNISARIVSVASDEPTIYPDDVYLGRARNVGSVAQAELVGTVRITGCAGGWSGTSGTYANFSAQTGCTYSINGNVEAPTTNIPGIRLRNKPSGKYVFTYSGNASETAASSECFFRASDGLNNSLEEHSPFSSASLAVSFLDFSIEYPNGLSDVTVQVQQKRTSGSANCQVYGTTANPGVIKVYRYPLSSEIAYRPEQINKFGSVLFSDSTFRSGGNVTSTTFTTASVASLQSYASYIGSAQACTTNTNFCVRIPQLPAGSWKVTITGGVVGSNGGNSGCMAGVFDGTSRESWFTSANGSEIYGNGIAYFTYTSQSDREFTLQTRRVSGSGKCYFGFGDGADSSTNSPPLRITVEPANPSLLAPNLVGSVTSLSTGSMRVETARITNNGSVCAVSSSSSSWITAGTRSGGVCASTITSGVFSSAPICTCTVDHTATSSGECSFDSPITATSLTNVTRDSAGTQVDRTRNIICVGPRGSL